MGSVGTNGDGRWGPEREAWRESVERGLAMREIRAALRASHRRGTTEYQAAYTPQSRESRQAAWSFERQPTVSVSSFTNDKRRSDPKETQLFFSLV